MYIPHPEFSGCGDLKIHDVSHLPDPCPLPDKLKKRSLVEKEKLVYAPFSGVGGIVYDKDAVYVELGGSHSHVHQVRHWECCVYRFWFYKQVFEKQECRSIQLKLSS